MSGWSNLKQSLIEEDRKRAGQTMTPTGKLHGAALGYLRSGRWQDNFSHHSIVVMFYLASLVLRNPLHYNSPTCRYGQSIPSTTPEIACETQG
jgi:hypothetical protein